MKPTFYIEARDLCIAYPQKRRFGFTGSPRETLVLDGVSFRLEEGARLGLLGRNGAGKSTLLRALAGIYPPIRGSLEVQGTVASIFNVTLGIVPEATGYENIYLRGTLLGLSFKEIATLVPQIVEFSELEKWIHRPVEEYSSGMTLRLAFSITTAVHTDILLLDEWLGAGDAWFLKKARQRMADLVDQAGILVLATHNVQLMRENCNLALFLDDGIVRALGPIDEVVPIYRDVTGIPKPIGADL